MSNITKSVSIFSNLTTNEKLQSITDESKKHIGLYVEMNVPEQRKYIKDQADEINQMIKAVEKARIAESKRYKAEVEKEAAHITEILVTANLPFNSLIDEYKEERKKILDAEKARKAAVEAKVKLEGDHEFGLLMNSQFDNDKITAERERLDYEAELKEEAIKEVQRQNEQLLGQQKQAEIQKTLDDEAVKHRAAQDKINQEWFFIESEAHQINADINAQIERDFNAGLAEVARLAAIETERLAGIERQRVTDANIATETAQREANKEHKAKVNNAILAVLLESGINEKDAKIMIRLAVKKELPQLTINY